MKKVLSLILAVAMLASFAMVASAADVMEFTLYTMDVDFNDATEFNAGDVFYIGVEATPATAKFGVEMDFDTKYFEIAQYNGGDDYDMSPYTGAIVLNPEGRANRLSFGGVQAGNRLKTLEGFIGIQIKADVPTGEYTFGTNFAEQAKNMPTDMTATANTVTVKINGTSVEPTEYAVTYATEDKFIWEANATTKTTDGKVTFTVKPAFGYVIESVTGVDSVIPAGGEMTATLTEDTEIKVTVAEKTDAAITYEYVTYDENYGWIAFGKVPAGTAKYGIDLDGTKYEGANAANGAFGVGFKGLAAGSYTATAYAGETLAATAATITVAE